MNKDFRDSIKPLIDLSAPDKQELKSGKHPVLKDCPHAKNLKGIDFDTICEKWYPSGKGKNVPCSVDALVFQNGQIYLIEFKSGKLTHVERKIYDSVMMLIEHDNRDFQTMRQAATYIVVSTKFDDSKNRDKAISRPYCFSGQYNYSNKPWNNPHIIKMYDSWNLSSLEDIIVSKTYCMPPSMFDKFVEHEGWK